MKIASMRLGSFRKLTTPMLPVDVDNNMQRFRSEYYYAQVCTVFAFFTLATVYLLLGMLVYNQLEGWKPLYALYFSIVTITTVGYGGHDLEPTDDGSRLFTIVYIVFGLFLVANRILNLVEVTLDRRKHYLAQVAEFEATTLVQGQEPDGKSQEAVRLKEPPSAVRYYTVNLGLIFSSMIAATLFGAAMFCATENRDLRYLDSIYFTWITITTIGYGDWELTNDTSIAWNCIFLLLSAILFTFLVGKLSELSVERQVEMRRWRIYSQRDSPSEMDETLLQKLSHTAQDGKHSRHSFLVEMLVHHELVQRVELELLDEYFDLIDADGSGTIEVAEVSAERMRVMRASVAI